MHILLTGDVRVGKSTVVQRTAALLGRPVGGFRTGFGPIRNQPHQRLFLWDAAGAPAYDEDHVVVRFADRRPQVLTGRFNTLGTQALQAARDCGAGLILMDECGRFEEQAEVFQQEIFTALEGSIPVLGVARQGFHGWLDRLRAHPRVTLVTVTADNRDGLPDQIAALLQKNG